MMLTDVFYMYSNLDNSSQILLFLIILVGLMLISICIINHITKKRNEKYDRVYNPIKKYTTVMNTDVKKETPVKIERPLKKEEKIEELKEEIEIMEDPEVIEVVTDDSSIDKISTLIEDNINNPKPIDLTAFEEEEEKNAIISYDELVRKAGAKKIVYKSEKQTINEEVKEEKIEIKPEEVKTKFKASSVISPIYGLKKPKEEETNKVEDEEILNDITFLTNLKTFRSNLD